jgi:paraquat-inducible protein B
VSKQANKTLIGAFVVGAVALVVAGFLIFGGGKFFTKTRDYVLYFDGSLRGLSIGSPVVFKGVKIGSVTNIKIRIEGKDLTNIRTPVFIEIESDRIAKTSADPELQEFIEKDRTYKVMDILVKRGLRAQLVSQSLVTGQLIVAFDFHPDTPINLVGGDPEYKEIPTIPSMMEELTETIKELPLKELVDQLLKVVKDINTVVNLPELKGSISALHETIKSASELVQNVNRQVDPMLSTIKETFETATATLTQAKNTLVSLEERTAEDSTLRYEFDNALQELSGAARSIRVLADYLQRHPESLLRGKGGSK